MKQSVTMTITLAVAGSLLVILAFGFLLLQVAAPAYIREELQRVVKENCQSCILQIVSIETPLFAFGSVVLNKVVFSDRGTQLEAKIEQIIVTLNLRKSSRRFLALDRLEFESPYVTYTDNDRAENADRELRESEPILFSIAETVVKHGGLLYLRNTHGTHAKLTVGDIMIKIDRYTNDPQFKNELVGAQIQARIEKSGAIDLNIQTLPFAAKLFIDVDLKVRDQNLADLTPFLKENAGVELVGMLIRGRSQIRVRDRRETARVWVDYRNLKVNVLEIYDRSGVVALLTTLGTDLTMDTENLGKPDVDKQRSVTYTRKVGQSIVGFMVQGMKEAAIKVTQASGRRPAPRLKQRRL